MSNRQVVYRVPVDQPSSSHRPIGPLSEPAGARIQSVLGGPAVPAIIQFVLWDTDKPGEVKWEPEGEGT